MMDQALKFTALDGRALRPYLLAMLVPLVFLLPLGILEPSIVITVLPLLAVIMGSSFVFSLEDSAGLNLLAGILPGNARNVVYGRYLLLLVGLVSALAVSVVVAGVFLVSGRGDLASIVLAIFSAFNTCLVFLSIQLPLFFRYGYLRARYWGYGVFLVLTGLFGAVLYFFPVVATWMFQGVLPLVLSVCAVGLYLASAWWSARALGRREF